MQSSLFTTKIGMVSLILLYGAFAHAEWYRYRNANGVQSVTSQISPEHIQRGYEVLDNNMRIVRIVPAYNEKAFAVQQAQRNAQVSQQQSEQQLIAQYISSSRATAQRDARLQDLNNRITKAEDERDAVFQHIKKLTEQAAQQQRRGKNIPDKITNELNTARTHYQTMQTTINDLKQRKNQTEQEYNTAINKLKQLESRS